MDRQGCAGMIFSGAIRTDDFGKCYVTVGVQSSEKKACTWFGEICSCSCLPVLPGPAGDLLSRICIPYFRAL